MGNWDSHEPVPIEATPDSNPGSFRVCWHTSSVIRRIPPGQRYPWPRYTAVVRDHNGRQKQRTFDSREEAEAWLESMKRNRRRRANYEPAKGRQKISVVAEKWLESRTGKRTNTRARDASMVNAHVLPAFGGMAIDRLGTHHVSEWLDELVARGLGADTIRKAHQTLSMILDYAIRTGAVLDNVSRQVHTRDRLPASSGPRTHFLTLEQLDRLIDSVDPDYRLATKTLVYTGMRLGELCALTVGDVRGNIVSVTQTAVEGDRGLLRYNDPKTTRSARRISVDPELAAELADHCAGRKPDEQLFTTKSGRPLRPSNFRNQYFIPALEPAGLPLETRPHDVRRSHGAALAAEGFDLRFVADRLGDSPATVIRVYSPFARGQDEALAQRFAAAMREHKRGT